MALRVKVSLCVLLVVLSASACGELPAATATPIPSETLEPTRIPSVDPTKKFTRTPTPSITYPPVNPGPFRRVAAIPEPFPNLYEEIQVRAPADGSVWVLTSRSVARWNGQEWNRLCAMEEDLLADVDDSGRLWLFRQEADEITLWQDGKWNTYGAGSGWIPARATGGTGWWSSKPWKVSVAADGTVWLPTEEDVRHFNGERWTIHTREDMGFPASDWEGEGIVHQIALVEGGEQVWVGECEYSGPGPVSRPGVRWFDGINWRGADAPVGKSCVSVVDVDFAGNVWIGAQDGIWRYEPRRRAWTSFSLPERFLAGYNFTYARELIVDRSGDIWVYLQYCGGATCDANTILHRIHAGMWSQVFEIHEWFMPFQRLALDGNGQGWLFWAGSVYQLLGDEIPAAAELPARGMDVSPDGDIWVAAGHESDAALWILKLQR